MTKVSFYGAAGFVTGSNFLVESDKDKYVVDCGLFQGRHEIIELNDDPFAYDPKQVKAVIVTHAHLDHIGRLPKLVRDGFRGPIYATEATIELATIVLEDALGLAIDRHEREGKPILYEQADYNRTLHLFKPVPYHKPIGLNSGDMFTLYDAGHILGSASVLLKAGGKNIVFSGDLGHWPNPLLEMPESPPEADLIVTEATYGGKNHKEGGERIDIIRHALEWTSEHNGVLLIPAFSIERTQELLFLIHELYDTHKMPKLPIFLDSPLAIKALEIFQRHYDLYRDEVADEIHRHHNLFDFKGLVLTPAVENSKDILNHPHPKVIIAGSGMMVGGRIVHHLKNYLGRTDTYLMIIGFQAPGTLGQRIVQGATSIQIHGQDIPIKAKVEVVEVFSGHADNPQLVEWLKKIKLSADGRMAIVHSEKDRAETFQEFIQTHLPGTKVELPEVGTTLEV